MATFVSTAPLWTAEANAVLYVGGSVPQWGSSADIGSQINAAYAALPSAGGEIVILPNSAGGPYNFTTPIVLATSGKYCRLRGDAPASQAGGLASSGSMNGVTLNYTPTSGTAITLDYVPAIGGGPTDNGLRDFCLTNQITTLVVGGPAVTGGSGSTAIGVLLGGTNSGIQLGTISGLRIDGFLYGAQINTAGGVSWGVKFQDCHFQCNGTGFYFLNSGVESISFFNCKFLFNGTAIGCASNKFASSDCYIYGGSIDSNTVTGIVLTGGGVLNCYGVHFENQGNDHAGNPLNAKYISHDGFLNVYGGIMQDDQLSSAPASPWFVNLTSSAAIAHIVGTTFFAVPTTGRTSTTAITNSGTLLVAANVLSPGNFTTFASGGVTTDLSIYNGNSATPMKFSSNRTTGGDIVQFLPNALVAGNWGVNVQSAGAADDAYIQLQSAVIASATNDASVKFLASVGGTEWGRINSSGLLLKVTTTPTSAANQLGFGTEHGFGNGVAGTAVTTTTKNTGTGPTTPQTVVQYLKVSVNGSTYWIPLVQ